MDRLFRSVRNLSDFKGRFLLAALALLVCVMAGSTPCLSADNTAKPHRKVLMMFEPEYPTILKNGHFEGQVRLEATVLPNGTVSSSSLARASDLPDEIPNAPYPFWCRVHNYR